MADKEIQCVEFKPATGGLVSETSHTSKGDKYGPSYKRETAVHSNLASAVRHMKKSLGAHFGKKEKGPGMKKG